MNIQKALKERIPNLVGELIVKKQKNTILVSGSIYSDSKNIKEELDNLLYEFYPNSLISNGVKINEFVVFEEEVQTSQTEEQILDEVNVLYYGYMDVNKIIPNEEFKIIHENNRVKLDNCVKVLNFIAPIVLNSEMKVVDGNFRLQLAKENDIDKVLVVIIDDSHKRADFLRLALNRTAEFQRWNYREVDDYVDNTPQAQPILEPIGFFGRHVLPESFFSPTVINYEIDPFNEKHRQYSQEEGLAEWAKYRREQMATLSAQKREKKPKKENAVSLFDLTPKKEDFLETYDIDEEMEEFVDKYKKIAGEITDHIDGIRRKEIEAKGGEWQVSHRTSQEMAEDNREKAIETIQNSDELTDDEKMEVISNIGDYVDVITNVKKIIKRLRNEE